MRTVIDWHIDMEFREADGETQAAVSLRLRDGTELRARGTAHRNPADPEQPQVGEEVAAARALDNLAHQLRSRAGAQIEEVTHEPARLTA